MVMLTMAEKGCLVIHGLTGTPATMKPLIDSLSRAGFLVNAPLLPGHGTSIEDLTKTKQKEWWQAVQHAYYSLKGEAKKVSCVGLSLGSILALKLAIEEKWGVRALVVMATPLVLKWGIEHLVYPLVKYSPARLLYKYSKKEWSESVIDPIGRSFYSRHSYDRMPIKAVLELFDLKKEVRKRLCDITIPILVLHGRYDTVAPLKNVDILRSEIKSSMMDIQFLANSKHVITLDNDKEAASKATVAFLNRFS